VKCLKLEDRFGDLGWVSVLIALPFRDGFLIDTWLMSCRVLKRTVEAAFFLDLVDFCREKGGETLYAQYIPTPKNVPVAELLPSLGFRQEEEYWRFDLSKQTPPTEVKICHQRA
jgi:predicted enzyme involved in methoxymalonyl-ACP biosynthesis